MTPEEWTTACLAYGNARHDRRRLHGLLVESAGRYKRTESHPEHRSLMLRHHEAQEAELAAHTALDAMITTEFERSGFPTLPAGMEGGFRPTR